MALEDVEEMLESLRGGAEGLETPLQDVIENLKSLGLASTDSAGRLRDLSGKFISKDQLQQIAGGSVGAADALAKLGERAGAAGEKSAAGGAGLSALADAGKNLGQSLMISGGAMGKFVGFLAQLGPQGQAAAVAISVLVTVLDKTAGTLAALSAKAIDVVQSVGLMTARFAALAGSAKAGAAVTAMVQRLGTELPFATEQIAGWTSALQRAGVEGKNLENATRAIAAAAALNPEGGANAAQETLSKLAQGGKEATDLIKAVAEGSRKGTGALREMGITLADLGGKAAVSKMSADQLSAAIEGALQAKGGGALSAMLNTWPSIIGKAREGFASIFEGLGEPVNKFMGAVRSLFGEFSRGGVAINVLKPIATAVFSALFEWGTKALNAIHKGFLYVVIGALTAYIALRPLINGIADFVGSANMLRGVAIVFGLLALPWVVLAVAIGTVVAVIGVVIAAIVAIGAALVYVIGAIAGFVGSIVGAFSDAYNAATGAGGSIVDGLLAGLEAGAMRFVTALAGLALQGLDAFKGVFKIASPSRVMLEHGEDDIAGAGTTGVERGQKKFKAAVRGLGDGAVEGGRGRGGAGGDDGDPRAVHYHYSGPVEHYPTFREHMRRFLEETAGEAGAAPAEAS